MGDGGVVRNVGSLEVQIDQALHGYSDGHRLLASSLKLGAAAQRTLLTMSDMSGPMMVPSFNNYLTGYPVVQNEIYALARTWYAPEMSRPGCVWTHTLLISQETLSKIDDLRELLHRFRRPSGSDYVQFYNSPIALISHDADYRNEETQSENVRQLHAFIALYMQFDRPVFISAGSSEQYEEFVLRVWTQQWPSLRARFSFCTGALADRKVNEKPLDLQVIPNDRLEKFRRSAPTGVFVNGSESVTDSVGMSDSPDVIPLLSDLYRSLYSEEKSQLGKFLSQYGPDLQPTRDSLTKLTWFYDELQKFTEETCNIPALITTIASKFPEQHEARSLKRHILGAPRDRQFLCSVSEAELLFQLAVTSSSTSAFDSHDLRVSERAVRLFAEDFESCVSLMEQLIAAEPAPIGEELIKSISQNFGRDEIKALNDRNPSILNVALTSNPLLATRPVFWSSVGHNRRDYFSSIAKLDSDPELARSVVFAILEARAAGLAAEVVNKFADKALWWVLDWLNDFTTAKKDLTNDWLHVFKPRWESGLDWISSLPAPPNSMALLLISDILPTVRSPKLKQLGSHMWLRLSAEIPTEGDFRWLRASAFLLALSFYDADEGGLKLAEETFQMVHDAAAQDRLDYETWQVLRNELPKLSRWGDWDRCERIRRGLVERFVKSRWPIEQFFMTVKEESTLKSITKSAEDYPAGRMLMRIITEAIDKGTLNISATQMDILRHRSLGWL
jgi:hypothetical protein